MTHKPLGCCNLSTFTAGNHVPDRHTAALEVPMVSASGHMSLVSSKMIPGWDFFPNVRA